MSVREPGTVRLVLSLVAAGLLSGTALAGVYVASAPRIARNRAEALERAVLEVVPGARRFEEWAVDAQGGVTAASADASSRVGASKSERVLEARGAGGERVGFAVVAEGPGFADTIRLIYGLDSSASTVVGLRILENRETPGLGDKILSDAAFVGSFQHLEVEPRIVAQTRGPRAAANEVDCISGATISSKAVIRIIQTSLDQWRPRLEAGSARGKP